MTTSSTHDPVMANILAPLAKHYSDPATVEIRMVEPEKVIVDRRGKGKVCIEDKALTLSRVEGICKSLANRTGLKFDPETAPKLSCILPKERHRFECLTGASVQSGLSLAIRCKHPFDPDWENFTSDVIHKTISNDNNALENPTSSLKQYLHDAVSSDKNIIISGATNTGKTTLLNMMLKFIPDERRVIATEDTPELELDRFWDGVGLLAAREADTASGMVSWRELYDHMMRATPDHILFGEISTQNAFAALAALNSGITGFMCTIHAESPHQALNRKFDQNIAWAGETMPRIPEFLNELVDVVIQIKRANSGFRRVSDIYQPKTGKFIMQNGFFLADATSATGAASAAGAANAVGADDGVPKANGTTDAHGTSDATGPTGAEGATRATGATRAVGATDAAGATREE